MFINMKIFGCKVVAPCGIIDIAEPVGYHKFIVPDEQLEERVEDVYYRCVETMWTDEGPFTSAVNIACYDDRLHRFATILINENGQKRVLFEEPDSEFVSCSYSSVLALIGKSSFCRIQFRPPFSDLFTVSCKVDIVRRRYFEDYVRVWGL